MHHEDSKQEQIYLPKPHEDQLTFRAVAVGCLLGGLVTGMNLYLGLKIGWTVGGSLMAAILGFSFFSLLKPKRPYTVLEANITQTAGSGAGTMASAAGLLAPIPAMTMLGHHIPIWGLFFWSAAVAYLGVMFAVPLRSQYVVIEKLRFPSGTATANTILAMFSSAGESFRKAKILLFCGLGAYLYVVASYFIPTLESPPIHQWLPIPALGVMALWGFKLTISPMLVGAGLIIGPRIGFSLIAGSVLGWVVLGSYVQFQGWAPLDNPMAIYQKDQELWGVRGWILWTGVAVMVADSLVSLLLSWRTFLTAFKGTHTFTKTEDHSPQSQLIPHSWWIVGMILSSMLTIQVAKTVFGIPPSLSIIAILLSALLAKVAVRATGETDINPVGGMGKVTQGIFGTLSSSIPTNLMAAGITSAGASQAGDMMHDLKAGYLLGASPRAQFKAQIIGITSGVFCTVPIYLLFQKAYHIGSPDSPLAAPAAHAWKAVAEVMSSGLTALPPMAASGIAYGALLGCAFPIIKKLWPSKKAYVPSGLAFGIAFIIPAQYTIALFMGTLAFLYWKKKNPSSLEALIFAVSCGLMAGEGLGGITNAVLTLMGVSKLF